MEEPTDPLVAGALAQIAKLGKPYILLQRSMRKSCTFLGGAPPLGNALEWPCAENLPLAFLAQLDLLELSHAAGPEWLPGRGRLYFFYSQELSVGEDPESSTIFRVIYDPMGEGGFKLPSTARDFDQVFLRPSSSMSLPSPIRVSIDLADLEPAQWDEFWDRLDDEFPPRPKHQIGDYPAAIEHDQMEQRCCKLAAHSRQSRSPEDWELLLQIDTDDEAGMLWSDSGTIYFWGVRSEMRAGEFSGVQLFMQSH